MFWFLSSLLFFFMSGDNTSVVGDAYDWVGNEMRALEQANGFAGRFASQFAGRVNVATKNVPRTKPKADVSIK